MDSCQAPYPVLKDFSNLASSRRYSRFLIDSPLLFMAESQYSSYCLIRRVVTLRITKAGSHYLLELSAKTLVCRLIRRVDTPCIVYYGESLLTTPRIIYSRESLLRAESYFQKLWRTPPSFKGKMKQKMNHTCKALLSISNSTKIRHNWNRFHACLLTPG
jgi:hypothetical protein